MSGAGEALLAAAAAALEAVAGIGRVYDAPPLQSALPHAVVAIDVESDWSHKSGAGRELRLTATLFDKGERPLRLRRLASEAETALGSLGGGAGQWRLVSVQYLRTRLVRERDGRWVAVIELRARMLRAD
jgi:hypothetical protein